MKIINKDIDIDFDHITSLKYIDMTLSWAISIIFNNILNRDNDSDYRILRSLKNIELF